MPPPCPQQVPIRSPQGEGGRGIADPAGKHPKISIVGEVELQDAGQELLRGVLARPEGTWGCCGSGSVVTPPPKQMDVCPQGRLLTRRCPGCSRCPATARPCSRREWAGSPRCPPSARCSSARPGSPAPAPASRWQPAPGFRGAHCKGLGAQRGGGLDGKADPALPAGQVSGVAIPGKQAVPWGSGSAGCLWLFSNRLSRFGSLGRTLALPMR